MSITKATKAKATVLALLALLMLTQSAAASTWWNVYYFDCTDIGVEVDVENAPSWFDPDGPVRYRIFDPVGGKDEGNLTGYPLEDPGDNWITLESWNPTPNEDQTYNFSQLIWWGTDDHWHISTPDIGISCPD